MIPRHYNRAHRDLEMRKLPLHRDPPTVWGTISRSPRAMVGAILMGIVIIVCMVIGMAAMP